MDNWTENPAAQKAVESLECAESVWQKQRRSTGEWAVVCLREPPAIECGWNWARQFAH